MLFTRYLYLKIETGPKFKLGKALRYLGQNILKIGHKMQENQFQPDKSKINILFTY